MVVTIIKWRAFWASLNIQQHKIIKIMTGYIQNLNCSEMHQCIFIQILHSKNEKKKLSIHYIYE